MSEETAARIELSICVNSQFGKEIDRIARQQNWSYRLTVHLLAAHALNIHHEYNADDIEKIIKGEPIE